LLRGNEHLLGAIRRLLWLGWLSFAGGLLLSPWWAKLVVARRTSLGKHLDSRALAGVTVAAGITELLGNLLFVVAAPRP